MHDYEYINKPEELLTPEVAKIQSTGASNLGKITKHEILAMDNNEKNQEHLYAKR